jgi:protein-L-isoaspartate(D-aspartate) O-methyltransferase
MPHAAFEALRVKMVDGQLRTTDVTSHSILDAFLAVPREQFVSDARKDLAYLDADIDLGNGRFLMEPSPLAKLIQLAEIKSTDTVLDIGCATGYGAAVLGRIAAHVVALEEDAVLGETAKANLSALGAANVTVSAGPLHSGAASKGPYNVIVIEGAVDSVPAALFAQLADGGRLVAVEGEGLSAVARVHVKSGKTVSARRGFNLSVKPLPGFKAAPVFSL